MSRPLMYDDQFTSLIHSNVRQKFLFCFQIKVQSTAFYRTCSLQNSIRICSLYDLFPEIKEEDLNSQEKDYQELLELVQHPTQDLIVE